MMTSVSVVVIPRKFFTMEMACIHHAAVADDIADYKKNGEEKVGRGQHG